MCHVVCSFQPNQNSCLLESLVKNSPTVRMKVLWTAFLSVDALTCTLEVDDRDELMAHGKSMKEEQETRLV